MITPSILQLNLFGYPKIILDGEIIQIKSSRTLALVAYLALYQLPTSRLAIGELLWSTPEAGRIGLRKLLYNLKGTIFDPYLLISEDTIQLNPELDITVDAWTFLEGIPQTLDGWQTASRLLQVTEAYTGEFLENLVLYDAPFFEKWVLKERKQFRDNYLHALENLAQLAQENGEIKLAIQYTENLIAADPLRESSYRMLMRLYTQQRQPERAMRQYHHLVQLLREELGLDPQPATRQMYDDLLKIEIQPEDTDPLVEKKISRVNLYPPMPHHMVGVDAQLVTLHRHLLSQDVNTLALLGAPGSGKTALAAAIVNNIDIHEIYADGILWVTLGAQPDIEILLSTWCEVLGIEPSSNTEATHMKLHGAIHDSQLLIIIDDIWQAEDALPFWLPSPNIKTIITTRYPNIARALIPVANGYIHTVEGLQDQYILTLVSQYNHEIVEAYHAELINVLPRLGGSPLAAHQWGCLMAEEWEFDIDNVILGNLDDLSPILRAPIKVDPLASPLDRRLSIAKRFQSMLPSDSQIAGRLRALPRTHMTADDLSAAWGDDWRELLRQLTELGVIYLRDKGQFMIHPLWFEVLT